MVQKRYINSMLQMEFGIDDIRTKSPAMHQTPAIPHRGGIWGTQPMGMSMRPLPTTPMGPPCSNRPTTPIKRSVHQLVSLIHQQEPYKGRPIPGTANWLSELDHNNPVAVCDVQTTQSVTQAKDGTGNSVTTTSTPTYDNYGRVTQETSSTNGGAPMR